MIYLSMIAAAVLALAGLFLIEGPDGRPLLSIEDLKPATPAPELGGGQEPVTVYRWQDENGRWHFSNDPRDAEGAETVIYDGKITTMEPVGAGSAAPGPVEPGGAVGLLHGGPLGNAMQALEDAGRLQETIDQRKQDIDRGVLQDAP